MQKWPKNTLRIINKRTPPPPHKKQTNKKSILINLYMRRHYMSFFLFVYFIQILLIFHFVGFVPFDLEEWWGNRTLQKIQQSTWKQHSSSQEFQMGSIAKQKYFWITCKDIFACIFGILASVGLSFRSVFMSGFLSPEKVMKGQEIDV